MKTKQEQIEKIQEIINNCYEVDSYIAAEGSEGGYIDTEEAAKAIVDAGYGDVSEYKAEIERLKEENKRAAISYTEYVLEEDTRFSVLRDNVAKLEQKNKRLCEENIEQYKKLKKQERKTVKQSQIDVLNKVKERAVGLAAIETYHICNLIDELINEVKNEQKD